MAVASLYPAIKPSLLLDFANTKKLDPRVTFTRSTTAAYYDGVTTAKAEENLLLNSVSPANSSWAWANGYSGSFGSELVVNGDFATSSDWDLGTGWSITGGEAVNSGGGTGQLRQIFPSISVGWYVVEFDATVSASQVNVTLETVSLGGANSSGSYKYFVYIASTSQPRILFSPNSGFVGSIDNVSVKQVTPDSVTAPDGTSTASTFTADAADATFTQSVALSAGEYTFSVYLRRVTGTGNIDITTDSAGTWVTQSITSSWARYTVTQTLTAGTRRPGVRIVTSGDQVEIWGAQLEQRSSATAYTPTTTQPITNYIPVLLTAPANVPRFDHNPTTGESLGLLIEEQRTNLLTYSDDFADASWTKSNATIDSNTVVAPDGTLTGDTVVETTATGGHSVRKSSSVTSGTFYTISAFVKAAGRNWVRIAFSTGFTSTNTWFDIANGVVGTVGATSASITDVGNGWYRISATQAATSTTTGLFFITMETSGSGVTYTGDGWSGIYIWGAQLEAGSFPTSYIPTTSATVTRNADLAVMAGSNFSSWYNAGEGTFYFESTWSKPTTSQVYVLSSGSSVRYIYDSSSSASSMSVSSFDGTNVLGGGSGLSGFLKIVSSYSNATGTKQIASNGGTVYSGAYNGNFATNTTILFGETAFCGNIKKIAYYPQRLTNANLQALTT